jgi:hypothetical protein
MSGRLSPLAWTVGLPGKVVVVLLLLLRMNIVPAIIERVKSRNPLLPPSTFRIPHPSTAQAVPYPYGAARAVQLEVVRGTETTYSTYLLAVTYDLSASGAWRHPSSWLGCCVAYSAYSCGSEDFFLALLWRSLRIINIHTHTVPSLDVHHTATST